MGILVRGLGFQIGHMRREENERLPNLISESFGGSNLSRSIESQIYPINIATHEAYTFANDDLSLIIVIARENFEFCTRN